MKKYVAFFVFIALLVSGCKDDTRRDINIAAILDMTGHYSQFGKEARDALVLMNRINDNLDISYYDSRGLSTVADSILDKIIAEKKHTNIVTLTSWISNDVAEKVTQHNFLQFPIGSAAFSKSNLLSSVMMTENVESESIYLINQLALFDKIAIMYFNNDFGITWFTTLSNSLGNKVVASEVYADNQTDFSAELSRIALTDPKIVVLISTREAALILNQAAKLGLHAQFYGTRPILTNELLAEPASDGLVFSYPKINYSYNIMQKFQTGYGYKPGSFAAEAIDLCIALINAANLDKYLPDDVFGYLKNSTLTGAFNTIHFDEMCRANYEFTLMKVKDGSFAEIK